MKTRILRDKGGGHFVHYSSLPSSGPATAQNQLSGEKQGRTMNPLIQFKRAIPPSAHLLRGAFYLLPFVAICAIPFAVAEPNAPKRSLVKLGSASKGLVEAGDALPATSIVVTNTNDSGPGSLRNALAVANDGDTIDATGLSGAILLRSGELQVTHNVTMNGPGAGSLAVNGNGTFRVFEIFALDAIISGFTITNGSVTDVNGGGGILNHGGLTLSDSVVSNCATSTGNNHGGGISNNPGAILTVIGSTINGNHAGCQGGGIYSSNAQLTVMNSTISGNLAHTHLGCGGSGGGIFYNGGGTLTVMNSVITGNSAAGGGGMCSDLPVGTTATVTNTTISGNFAGAECELCGSGGGIFNHGQTLTVTNSTISDNGARGSGGGVVNDGDGNVTVTNSTISGNSSERLGAGGIENNGNLAVTNSTLSDNSASTGGSILNGNGGVAQIGDTVLNAGAFGGTILNNGGTMTSLGYNLASDNGGGVLTGPGDQINTDPMLGPLQDNGGPTFTHALLPGSPAIDAGDPSFTPPPFFDQRGPGFARVANRRIDKGSFEVQAPMAQSAFSRKTHGAAGTFDVNLPLTGTPGVECRTSGGTNDYTMVVTFSGNITVTGSPQAEVTLGTGCVGTGGACSGNVTVSANTVTVPLTNVANVQTINVRINGVNGASASDQPATDFTIPMSILIGDTNGNRTVNAADVAQTKGRLGQTVDASNFRSDANTNGSINAADTAVIKGHLGTGLP
jgi:hypothetical protein